MLLENNRTDNLTQSRKETDMNRYPVPELKDLPDDIRARILEVQEKAGFVPNVFLALAHRPGRVPRVLRLPRCADAEGRAAR